MAVTVRTSTPDQAGSTTFSFSNGADYTIDPAQILHVSTADSTIIASFRHWNSATIGTD